MIGYRDNDLFGDGYTDPLEVSYYETSVLGNTDIPDHILNQERLYGITEEEYGFLRDICEYNVDEIDKWYFQEIIQKYIGDRNCCLWLCKRPEDVYNSYIAPMSGETVSFEEYRDRITAYEIPDDALVMSDGGTEGALYCFNRTSYREYQDEVA
ncbi:MAG: hypothetical protein J5966_04690 [Lachnospiraceae bacterium]|nr:hypothetical protein [Lachnospiraceae bacterium]